MLRVVRACCVLRVVRAGVRCVARCVASCGVACGECACCVCMVYAIVEKEDTPTQHCLVE